MPETDTGSTADSQKRQRLCLHLKRLKKPGGVDAVGSGTETNAQAFASAEPSLKARKPTEGRPTGCPPIYISDFSLVVGWQGACHKNPIHPAEAHLSPLD